MKAFSTVIASGSLRALEQLSLGFNQIGDKGMIAFANAIKPSPGNPMGSLGSLSDLIISNPSQALRDACSSRKIGAGKAGDALP